MEKIYDLKDIKKLDFKLKTGDLVFLKGDLGAGKTTISKYILSDILSVKDNITSPTYTYYNKYRGVLEGKKIDIYHFDLYRLSNYDEFFAIGAEEILDNNSGIILMEWPDIIEKYYKANLEIIFEKLEDINKRKIILNYI